MTSKMISMSERIDARITTTTAEEIGRLQSEAAQAGDTDMVRACEAARGGDAAAIRLCARALVDAEGQA